MKNADLTLYKAKEHGRDNFQFFVEAMNRAAVAQMAMESALRAAIRDEKFVLHYQPQMDLSSGKVTYAEALLRWPQGNGKMIPPNEFIPLAEANGLLNDIGV
jgi:predicted signal transduction protein with EAL and GGDEF domain